MSNILGSVHCDAAFLLYGYLPVLLGSVDAGHEFFGILFRGLFDVDAGGHFFGDPDVRVVRLDIAWQRFAGPGVLAFLFERSVKSDDVDDIEEQAGADEELHVRHGLHEDEFLPRHMLGFQKDDGAHDIRGECTETLRDGDDH